MRHIPECRLWPRIALAIIACAVPSVVTGAEPQTEGRDPPAESVVSLKVGVIGSRRNVVLEGTRLVAKPADRVTPFVVRIDAAYPHGSDWRYDLSFYGLEPGRYNVAGYLQRKDGSATDGLKPIWVEVDSSLPSGAVAPHALELRSTPRPSRYRMWLVAAGVVWTLGLIALLVAGRFRKKWEERSDARQATLADRLRPLVVKAQQGELSSSERAELERLLISFWQRKLQLHDVPPAEMMSTLRSHADAGPLLKQLEAWLHHPRPEMPQDIESLLAPYRNIRDSESVA